MLSFPGPAAASAGAARAVGPAAEAGGVRSRAARALLLLVMVRGVVRGARAAYGARAQVVPAVQPRELGSRVGARALASRTADWR